MSAVITDTFNSHPRPATDAKPAYSTTPLWLAVAGDIAYYTVRENPWRHCQCSLGPRRAGVPHDIPDIDAWGQNVSGRWDGDPQYISHPRAGRTAVGRRLSP